MAESAESAFEEFFTDIDLLSDIDIEKAIELATYQGPDFMAIRKWLLQICGDNLSKKQLLNQAILAYFDGGNAIVKSRRRTSSMNKIINVFGVVHNVKGPKRAGAPCAITLSRIAGAFAPEACELIVERHQRLFKIEKPSVLAEMLTLSSEWPTVIMWERQCCVLPDQPDNPQVVAVFKALVFLNAISTRKYKRQPLSLEGGDLWNSLKFCTNLFKTSMCPLEERQSYFERMQTSIHDSFYEEINNNYQLVDIKFPSYK